MSIEKMIIKRRDIDILEFINNMKIGELPILSLTFFNSLKVARRRLNILENSGLLKKLLFKCPNGFTNYGITKKGYNIYSNKTYNPIIPNYSKRETEMTLEHDRWVAICRSVLTYEGQVLRWRSERELLNRYSGNTLNDIRFYTPDGLFYNKNKELVSLEFELSKKSNKRLDEKFENQLEAIEKGQFKHCIFVCKSELTYEYLLKKAIGFERSIEIKQAELFENKFINLINSFRPKSIQNNKEIKLKMESVNEINLN